MKLSQATVRNYRIHREISIEFDPARTLIGGPNESGKSTFIEAVHRGLFLKAKGTTAVHKAMASRIHGSPPEVEVAFTAAGSHWTVYKRFSGQSGIARLTESGGRTHEGDEAEARLAELLGLGSEWDQRVTADRIQARWSHLWIWQGGADRIPTADLSSEHHDLVQRLQDSGGAAAVLSDLDSAVLRTVDDEIEATFTQRGEPKAGTTLARARDSLDEAEARQAEAQARVDRLENDIRERESAAATAEEARVALADAERRLAECEAAQKKVATLQGRKETLDTQLAAAEKERVRIQEVREAHATLGDEIKALASDLESEEERIDAAEQAVNRQRTLLEEARKEQAEAEAACRRTRLRARFLTAVVEERRQHRQVEALEERGREIARLRKSLDERDAALARLPAIDAQDPDRFRELDETRIRAETALENVAARLQVESADAPVVIDGDPVAPGEERTIFDESTIAVGQGVRIRVTPGGGKSLAEARQDAATAARACREFLEERSVPDYATLTSLLDRRREIARDRDDLVRRLAELDAAKQGDSLAAARTARETALAECERCRNALEETDNPLGDGTADLEAAQQKLRDEETALAGQESAEQRGRERAAAADADLETARETRDRFREERNQRNRDREAKVARRQQIEEGHGDAEAIANAVAEATRLRDECRTEVAAIEESLRRLDPETLERDQERFTRAREVHATTLREAETRAAIAGDRLQSDGSGDPYEALEFARAAQDAARTRWERLQHEADAVKLLHRLLGQARGELAETFSRPLAERIDRYLRALFGPDVSTQVDIGDDHISGIRLVRRTGTAIDYPFDDLSGGTREQLAGAIRLASAELLATGHDGSLPIVFDDAFAYSDPERVEELQRMLDLAARNGLQVIVLTCNPADYRSFGARTHLIDRA